MDDLRNVLGLTPSGAVRLVDRLAADGYVERRAGADGRSLALRLTPAGSRVARRVLSAARRGARCRPRAAHRTRACDADAPLREAPPGSHPRAIGGPKPGQHPVRRVAVPPVRSRGMRPRSRRVPRRDRRRLRPRVVMRGRASPAVSRNPGLCRDPRGKRLQAVGKGDTLCGGQAQRLDRRAFVRLSSCGAGLLWAAPSIRSVASVAAGSPPPPAPPPIPEPPEVAPELHAPAPPADPTGPAELAAGPDVHARVEGVKDPLAVTGTEIGQLTALGAAALVSGLGLRFVGRRMETAELGLGPSEAGSSDAEPA